MKNSSALPLFKCQSMLIHGHCYMVTVHLLCEKQVNFTATNDFSYNNWISEQKAMEGVNRNEYWSPLIMYVER